MPKITKITKIIVRSEQDAHMFDTEDQELREKLSTKEDEMGGSSTVSR